MCCGMLDVVLVDVKFQEGVGGNREQRVEALPRAQVIVIPRGRRTLLTR